MRESDEVNSSDKQTEVTREMTQIEGGQDVLVSTVRVNNNTVLGYLHETEPTEKCQGH